MAPLAQETVKYSEQEEKLFRELDKGIDDMEQGNTIPHEEAMRQIRERLLKEYAIQVTCDKGSVRRCNRVGSQDEYHFEQNGYGKTARKQSGNLTGNSVQSKTTDNQRTPKIKAFIKSETKENVKKCIPLVSIQENQLLRGFFCV